MKKIIYLGSIVGFAGVLYGFVSVFASTQPYCITMHDVKGRRVQINIEANGANEAIRNAKSLYPQMKYHGISYGKCK